MKRYQIQNAIGDGTFGLVRTAVSAAGDYVAIKTLKAKVTSWEACRDLREVASLSALSHPNIVKLKEVIREGETVHLVFELCQTTLCRLINDRKEEVPFRDDEVRLVMFQVFSGLAYIHARGILHRDVKPENVLCSGLEAVKLADFGLARTAAAAHLTEYISTRWYRAPELLLHAKTYGTPIDVWAAGVLLAELYLLRPLFPGTSDADQLYKICSVLGTPPPEQWPEGRQGASTAGTIKLHQMPPTPISTLIPHASPLAVDLLQKLLQFNAEARLTAREALRHPFFTEI